MCIFLWRDTRYDDLKLTEQGRKLSSSTCSANEFGYDAEWNDESFLSAVKSFESFLVTSVLLANQWQIINFDSSELGKTGPKILDLAL